MKLTRRERQLFVALTVVLSVNITAISGAAVFLTLLLRH
jgi:hypothetical protein